MSPLSCNSHVLSAAVRLTPFNLDLQLWTRITKTTTNILSNLFNFNKFHINSVLLISCNISTISWSRPPVPLWNVLDLHQVALPLARLLVGLKNVRFWGSKLSKLWLCLSYLPLVVITIRILDALLGAVFHRFHLLQFRNHAKDRNGVLIGTLWQRKKV